MIAIVDKILVKRILLAIGICVIAIRMKIFSTNVFEVTIEK